MGNEKGFVLPFSMFLTFAILIFTMSAASIFVSRYSYLDTMESGYQREAIILYSLGILLESEDKGSGILRFNNETVHYQTQTQEQVSTLILTVEVDNKEYPAIRVTYDKETHNIISWE
ncbi:competence type IV pilus minor pilin ComGG [Bacillus sp. AK031]